MKSFYIAKPSKLRSIRFKGIFWKNSTKVMKNVVTEITKEYFPNIGKEYPGNVKCGTLGRHNWKRDNTT